jgi:hypothetical protein
MMTTDTGLVPWCARCETWHGSDEDHWDEIEAAAMANKFDGFTWDELNVLWSSLHEHREAAKIKSHEATVIEIDDLLTQMYRSQNWGAAGLDRKRAATA